MTPEDKARRAAKLTWFHSIDLGDGVVTKGIKPAERLAFEVGHVLHDSPQDASVLDIGAWNGFFSFEAKKRGASRVLATDWFCWGHADNPRFTRDGFDFAREALGLDVEDREIDVPDLTVDAVGEFDVVLFLGVFYHLKHPFLMLEQIAPIARETLVVETYVHRDLPPSPPAMVFFPGRELANDPTNWWGPNEACVVEMLKTCGFPRVDVVKAYGAGTPRALFKAHRD